MFTDPTDFSPISIAMRHAAGAATEAKPLDDDIESAAHSLLIFAGLFSAALSIAAIAIVLVI